MGRMAKFKNAGAVALAAATLCSATVADAAPRGSKLPPVIVAPVTPPPPVSVSPTDKIGDWVITYISKDSAISSVKNDGGATLGSICTKTGCTPFFNPNIKCDDGGSYPILINSPSLSFNVLSVCAKLTDTYIYVIPDSDSLREAFAVGGVLGIAFPMQSGEFRVSRFSLTGAARSIAQALNFAQQKPAESKGRADNYAL
jgi:hypothetical protein